MAGRHRPLIPLPNPRRNRYTPVDKVDADMRKNNRGILLWIIVYYDPQENTIKIL